MTTNDKYTDKALAAFEAGFNSIAAKKRCMQMISRAYERLTECVDYTHLGYPKGIMCECLAMRDSGKFESPEEFIKYYWKIPSIYNWKEHHSKLYKPLFPEQVEKIEYLVELRQAVKDTIIKKVEKSKSTIKRERVEKTIKEFLEMRKASYERGINLSEHFGTLDVHANAHWVVNEHGTKFIRHFYYMHGKLTALNTIIAVAQEIERKEKENA